MLACLFVCFLLVACFSGSCLLLLALAWLLLALAFLYMQKQTLKLNTLPVPMLRQPLANKPLNQQAHDPIANHQGGRRQGA